MNRNQATMKIPYYMQSVNLIVENAEFKRQEIKESFNQSFSFYEHMFELIQEDALFIFADPLRHPLIFYYGHTASFYINKLVTARILKSNQRINAIIEGQTAIGVDEMSWDSLSPSRSWPSFQEMKTFRNKVQILVNQLIDEMPLENNSEINYFHNFWVILMGTEHEKIHLETSTVLIRQLPIKMIKQIDSVFYFKNFMEWKSNLQDAINIEQNLIQIDSREVSLGRQYSDFQNEFEATYGWDNEFGNHKAQVQKFKVTDKLISNAQFYEFVLDQGYDKREYWSDDGFKWAQSIKNKHPKFWIKKADDQFVIRFMASETSSMPWDFPVEVNCYEAMAYSRFISIKYKVNCRLPTEDEYYSILNQINYNHHYEIQNIAITYSSPTPIDLYETKGIYDITGNVWQWTKTPTYPFNNFEVHPIYDDFTMPTFDDRQSYILIHKRHNLIKGGSWISTGNLANPQSRYAFRLHFFQHAGFRLVYPDESESNEDFYADNQKKNINTQCQSIANPYESDPIINQYLQFDYGDRVKFLNKQFPQFPVLQAIICQQLFKEYPIVFQGPLRALDIGCAVGRTSFELSRLFDQVIGIDISARFIQAASMLQQHDYIPYKIPKENDIYEYKQASLNNLLNQKVEYEFLSQIFDCMDDYNNQNQIKKSESHIKFIQRDACNLSQDLDQYHLVIASNLVDRINDPQKFLQDIQGLVHQDGLLIILSPYTWNTKFTPKEKWLSGNSSDDQSQTAVKSIEKILEPWFKPYFIEISGTGYDDPIYGYLQNGSKHQIITIPFCLKENTYSYEFTYSELTIWIRK